MVRGSRAGAQECVQARTASMTWLVPVAFCVWIICAIALFIFFTPRRAVLIGFVTGWMFLPIALYPIAGTPGFAKTSATCLAMFLAIALFDFRRLMSLRLGWFDVPILLFCLTPFASSFANHLGTREGLSAVFFQVVTWGIPYTIGRLYFDDFPALRELATGIFAGGLAYVPLC